jgi:hypothetical protein
MHGQNVAIDPKATSRVSLERCFHDELAEFSNALCDCNAI